VTISFRDHRGFQRAALAVAGAGGVAALAVALLQISMTGPVVLTAASVALVPALRARGLRRLLAVLAVVGTAALVASLAGPLTDLLGGVVVALGLVPLHLELRSDPVERALAAARLDPERRRLCLRAAAAEQEIRQALLADRIPDARALRRQARLLVLATVDTAGKACLLAERASAVDEAELEARIAALIDGPAVAALREQQAHLAALRASAERLRAHLHGQVALLEGTALALAARRGALAADQAAAQGPVAERLREVGSDSAVTAAVLLEESR
jgi:hypothetical protein